MTIALSSSWKCRILMRNLFAKYQNSLKLYFYRFYFLRLQEHQNSTLQNFMPNFPGLRYRFLSYLKIVIVLKYGSIVIWSQRSINTKFFCTTVFRRDKLPYIKKILFESFLWIRKMNDEKLVFANYSYILEKLTFLRNFVFLLVFWGSSRE